MEKALSLEKISRNRVRVTLSSGVFVVPSSEAPPGTDHFDPVLLGHLQKNCARKEAQRFLEYAERSSGQLEKKMRSLGYESAVVREISEWAQKYDFVNDVRFSELFIRSSTMGKLRLRAELLKRGVAESAVEKVLAKVSDQADFDEVAALVKNKYAGVPNREKALRRAAGWLERRGYSGEFIHRVLKEMK